MLSTDALPWTCLQHIKLNEYDTTSSSRIFIKILVQDLAETLGLAGITGSPPFDAERLHRLSCRPAAAARAEPAVVKSKRAVEVVELHDSAQVAAA